MLPVLSIKCRPIAVRALCGVRPTTPASFATSFQMLLIITSESRPLSLVFLHSPDRIGRQKQRWQLPPLIVLFPLVLHVIADRVEAFFADLITVKHCALFAHRDGFSPPVHVLEIEPTDH